MQPSSSCSSNPRRILFGLFGPEEKHCAYILRRISHDTFLLLGGGQCMHLPSAIQTMNRTHVSAFKCTISSTLQKMLSAGINGTSGTLNRRPTVFC